MLADARAVPFIPITDGARARAFYEGVLGLEFVHEDGFALVVRSGAIEVRMPKVQDFTPQPFTIFGWHVGSVAATARAMAAAGVPFERFPGMDQDDLGIWLQPGGSAAVAWFKDPDGNLLSISGLLG